MAAVQWDPFEAIERDVRAMVADQRWADVPAPTQAQAMAARLLRTPDGGCWLFGTHARWHRHDQADGEWHLSAPPAAPQVRAAALPAHPAPPVPGHLLPAAADLALARGSTQAFVGPDVPRGLADRIRELLDVACGLREENRPFTTGPLREVFHEDATAPVAAMWGAIMWTAYAPAFDGNERLLSMFGEFLDRPLPGDDWVRWLPAMPLSALTSLYAERLARGARAATLVAAHLTDTASALLADPRFEFRAAALLAMVTPLRSRPWLDHPARDAETMAQAWMSRCPPSLRGALLPETSPGEHFRHTFYDLVEALSFVSVHGADPRAVAASLLAADVDAIAPTVAPQLYPWLDAELRRAFQVALGDPGHPLRGCWPRDGEPPEALRPADRNTAAALLGAGYATGLAWCRLTGTVPPPRGFPTSSAMVTCLIHQRDDPVPGAPATSAEWIRHR
ncbi:hypothetical protein Sme01_45410 [Sphaerisporangium melleum]|uniref:Uncharacterized protein n=1 Tax=Sphaerisporangium melleum TaxID=321316 RepID=A0A917VI26_9ACTN|nr:hypothetical protein [Sphaerisporangium melleum]GGK80276.1 hypothetical protein GCM10007964_23670 [Sphaerisporangium melleum]GII72065.1 hypothetical protein Sme01_45410 [Sphaerisporangium melleum]